MNMRGRQKQEFYKEKWPAQPTQSAERRILRATRDGTTPERSGDLVERAQGRFRYRDGRPPLKGTNVLSRPEADFRHLFESPKRFG